MDLNKIPDYPYKKSEIFREGKTNPRLAQRMLQRNMKEVGNLMVPGSDGGTSPVNKQPIPTDKEIYEMGKYNPRLAARMLQKRKMAKKEQSSEQTGARPEQKPRR